MCTRKLIWYCALCVAAKAEDNFFDDEFGIHGESPSQDLQLESDGDSAAQDVSTDPQADPRVCEDVAGSKCTDWAAGGDCKKFVQYMVERCARTCGFCGQGRNDDSAHHESAGPSDFASRIEADSKLQADERYAVKPATDVPYWWGQPLKWDSEEHRNAKWWIQDTESVLHGRRCDLPIIDGAHLSLDEYEKSIRDKHAVLLTNLTKGWKAFSEWDEDGFATKFSDVPLVSKLVKTFRTTNNSWTSVKDYFKHLRSGVTGQDAVIYEYMANNFNPFVQDYNVPDLFVNMNTFPVISIFGARDGVSFDQHDPGWLALLRGQKHWMLAHRSFPRPTTPQCTNEHTCSECMNVPSEETSYVQHCEQRPGEVVYFPEDWWHCTCNNDDFTIGVGGQKHADWPVHVNDLVRATVQNDTAKALSLLNQGLAVDIADQGPWLMRDEDHHSGQGNMAQPIHFAAKAGSLPLVKALIENGADATISDNQMTPPICTAARHGHLGVVEHLIARGVPLDCGEWAVAPLLHQAVSSGVLQLVEYLVDVIKLSPTQRALSKRCDVDQFPGNVPWCFDPAGLTPIAVAHFWGLSEISDYLIDRSSHLSDL